MLMIPLFKCYILIPNLNLIKGSTTRKHGCPFIHSWIGRVLPELRKKGSIADVLYKVM